MCIGTLYNVIQQTVEKLNEFSEKKNGFYARDNIEYHVVCFVVSVVSRLVYLYNLHTHKKIHLLFIKAFLLQNVHIIYNV